MLFLILSLSRSSQSICNSVRLDEAISYVISERLEVEKKLTIWIRLKWIRIQFFLENLFYVKFSLALVWLWLALAGSGWFLGGSSQLWMILGGGCGWLWQIQRSVRPHSKEFLWNKDNKNISWKQSQWSLYDKCGRSKAQGWR